MMIKHDNKHVHNDSDDNEDDDNDDENQYSLTRNNILYFGKRVLPYFRIQPRPSFLLGSLDKEVVQKVRKQRETKPRKEKQKLDKEAARTQIKELNKENVLEENDKNPTVSEIERVYTILKKYHKRKGSPVGLYEFIINPTSFSRSIENMFYLSFLVKDGYAKLFLDASNGLPFIEPIIQNAEQKEKNKQSSNEVNYQSMISLTKPDWREIVDTFKIQVQVIPDPPPSASKV
jgi:non-structural maintenance of chromosomes element 4